MCVGHLRRPLQEPQVGVEGYVCRGRVATWCICVDHLTRPPLKPQVQAGSFSVVHRDCIGYWVWKAWVWVGKAEMACGCIAVPYCSH